MILSIIIPVYNVEKTLDRCVESVLQQDIKDMEVILVDDGSPDSCGEMCERLALKDERIRVIHKQNGGLSSARNAGLQIAKGEYVTFVDSDDYILPDTYCRLIKKLSEYPDISILEYCIINESEIQSHQQFEDIVFDSPRKYWLSTKAWNHSYACNKIFHRQLFANARFEEGKVFEDLLLMPILLSKEPKIATTAVEGYVYSTNAEGISCNISPRNCYNLLVAEIKAALKMKTMPWGKGLNLYYLMLCRIYDIIRLSL